VVVILTLYLLSSKMCGASIITLVHLTQAGLFVRLNTINYGVNYNAPVFAHTELSFGVNGMYQNNRSKNATDFPIPDYNSFDAGVYGFAKWKYGRWTIGGGLRYDQRYQHGDDFYTKTDPATNFSSTYKGRISRALTCSSRRLVKLIMGCH
jgi:outer membrane cobalamin receptor